jgi:hypothetical protein
MTATRPIVKPLRFTENEVCSANETWGANCGPIALAAMTNKSLSEIRPYLGAFETKRCMSPTDMLNALSRLGMRWIPGNGWPTYGLAWVQWEGPWSGPKVPARVGYRYSHWVGSSTHQGKSIIFDINCLEVGGWVFADCWSDVVVPYILQDYPRANGKWHISRSIELLSA